MQPPPPNLSTPSSKEAKEDWSRLPLELQQLISEKLNSELYILRFRSVCSWWRTCIRGYPNNHSSWELPEFPHSDEGFYVRRLSKQNIYLIKPPPQHQPTLPPWLIRIGRDVNGNLHLWHPFDGHQSTLLLAPFCFDPPVIDFNQLSVLDLEHKFDIQKANSPNTFIHDGKVIVATDKGGEPLDLMTYDNNQEPKILRYGKDSWTSIPTIERSLWGDICIFKGKICVADKNGRTVIIEPDYSVHLLANPVCFGANVKFLVVESECESLLLVDCHGIDTGAADDDITFEVFKLDEKNKRWIKLSNLENRVLFLGEDCSFCVSASNLSIGNGNCIIYSRDYEFQSIEQVESGMRIFHLDQGRVSRLSNYPEYFKLFWPPPEWIVRRRS